MSTVRISGVIVPSDYDMQWFDDEIARGVMTPLSRVESALRDASDDEPLTVYINSPGGSVFAGNEMLNALRSWERETGQAVNVTVGAMAASAAGTLAVMLGPVSAHANSRFMFHSATSVQIGGPRAMEDVADLLDGINSDVVTALVSRYGFDPDAVATWFSEGRMGWVDANEAVERGLVSEIIDEPANPLAMTERDLAEYARHGLDGIAAIIAADIGDQTMDEDKNTEVTETESTVDTTEETTVTDEETTETDATEEAQVITSAHVDMAYEEGYAAGEAAAKAEGSEALAEELAAEKQRADELTVQVSALRMKVARLDKGFKPGNGSGSEPSAESSGDEYWRRVAELCDDGVEKGVAMLRVQREHPEAHKAMLAAAKAAEKRA